MPKVVAIENDFEVVATGDLVFDFAEDFADFVFDRVWAGGFLLQGLEVREDRTVDEINEVVAGLGLVVVEFAGFVFRSGPGFPAALLFEDVGVAFAVESGFVGPVLFEAVEVFQEDEQGGLFGVVEFGGAAGLFAEDVVDVFEGLFEH